MIQRIQSVWLLLAAVLIFLTFEFPFFIGTNADGIASYELSAKENLLFILLSIITGGLAFVTIFLFKKRDLQVLLCVVGLLLEGVLIYLYYHKMKTFQPNIGGLGLGSMLHIPIVVFFLLALKGINGDKKLIRDSDRLR